MLTQISGLIEPLVVPYRNSICNPSLAVLKIQNGSTIKVVPYLLLQTLISGAYKMYMTR